MAPPLTEVRDIQLQLTTHLSTRRDERLSWPGWLTHSRRFTHISGHPSATGRAKDRESIRRPKTDVLSLSHATNRERLERRITMPRDKFGPYPLKAGTANSGIVVPRCRVDRRSGGIHHGLHEPLHAVGRNAGSHSRVLSRQSD